MVDLVILEDTLVACDIDCVHTLNHKLPSVAEALLSFYVVQIARHAGTHHQPLTVSLKHKHLKQIRAASRIHHSAHDCHEQRASALS